MVERERDIEKAFQNIINLAVELNVDAITVSGDLLHSTRPTSRTMEFLAEMHGILKKHAIPCLVSSGNHDKSEPHWIEIFEEEDADSTGGFVYLDDKQMTIGEMTIYGQPFVSRKEWEEKKNDIPSVDVLLMHQSFSEFAFAVPDTSFYPEDLSLLDVDTVIMGDTHVTDLHQLSVEGKSDITIVSPGSTELVSASESPDKGVVLLSKEPGGEIVRSTLALKTRPVVKGLVDTEEDVKGILDFIEKEIASEKTSEQYEYPLVFLEYDPEVAYVVDNVRRNWPGMMLRARPKRSENDEISDEVVEDSGGSAVEVASILNRMLPQNTNSATDTLAHELLKPECDVNIRLDDYVKQRKEALDV